MIARIVGGLSKGNIALSMSIITDVSTPATRGRAMALVGIAFSLGFIVGPMIGATFAAFADKGSATWYWYPAAFATLLAVADVLFVCVQLEETLPVARRSRWQSALTTMRLYMSVPALFRFAAVRGLRPTEKEQLRRLGWINFLYLFVYSGLEFTVTFLMYHKFGYTSLDQAKMFLTTGVVMTALQGGVVRRLPESSTKRAAVAGLWLIVPAFVVVGLAESTAMLYAGMVLFAICKCERSWFWDNKLLRIVLHSHRICGHMHDGAGVQVRQRRPEGHRAGHLSLAGRIGTSSGSDSGFNWYVFFELNVV